MLINSFLNESGSSALLKENRSAFHILPAAYLKVFLSRIVMDSRWILLMTGRNEAIIVALKACFVLNGTSITFSGGSRP